MKRAKPYRFDPFAAMSYHDLNQEARRLRRANRKLRNAIRRRADEERDSDKFVLENAPVKSEPCAEENPRTPGKPCCFAAWTAGRDNKTF